MPAANRASRYRSTVNPPFPRRIVVYATYNPQGPRCQFAPFRRPGLPNAELSYRASIRDGAETMTALQGWIVIGLLVLITLGIIGLGAEIEYLPYVWRTYSP